MWGFLIQAFSNFLYSVYFPLVTLHIMFLLVVTTVRKVRGLSFLNFIPFVTWWQLSWEWGKIEQFFRVRQLKGHSLLQLNESCFIMTCVRIFVMQVWKDLFWKIYASGLDLSWRDTTLALNLQKVTPVIKSRVTWRGFSDQDGNGE